MRSWKPSDKPYYINILRTNQEAILAAGARGLDPEVAGCPGWDVGDLVAHMGGTYTFWGKWIRERPKGPGPGTRAELIAERSRYLPGYEKWLESGFDRGLRPDGVMAFARRAGDDLVVMLGDLDPQDHVWTFFEPDQTGAFWLHRMAMETVIHRYDAEHAHGIDEPPPAELAANGIDEYVNVILHLDPPGTESPAHTGETWLLAPTDGTPTWHVAFPDREIGATESVKPADVEIGGSSSDLLLFLWGRKGVQELSVAGDERLASRWGEFAGRF